MDKKKIVLIVFGTRPEAIKLAPIIKKLSENKRFKVVTCSTGQHKEMLAQILNILEIKPDYNFDIMKDNQSLTLVTTNVIKHMETLIDKIKPDFLLVQGDTTSAMVSALSSYYKKIKLGHVEAGLRSFNNYAPWPEECNRKIISVIAEYHFAPTEFAKENLLNEGIDDSKIYVTGNTVIDSVKNIIDKINNEKKLLNEIKNKNSFLDNDKKLILVTSHRQENFDAGIKNLCNALNILSERNDVQILYSVHLNPNVRKDVFEIIDKNKKNILLVDPIAYHEFLYLMSICYLILTDSGGIQEESTFFGKPVLIMRDNTERPETLSSGSGKIIGNSTDRMINEIEKLLDEPKYYRSMSVKSEVFGDGKAAQYISELLCNKILV